MLETSRLRLRRWLPRDEPPFAAMNGDPEVMQYFPATITPEQTRMAIGVFEANFEQYGYSFWAVELKDSLEFIGSIGLEPYELSSGTHQTPTSHVAIGWQLARAYWGQGLAFEAAMAVCDFAKTQLKLNEIICVMAQLNQPSMALCRRLGMGADTSQRHVDGNFPPGHPLGRQALFRLALA